jgi:L-malate glycosyltransferase
MYLMDYLAGSSGGTEGQVISLIGGLNRALFDPVLAVFQETRFLKGQVLPFRTESLRISKIISVDTLQKLFKLSRYVRRNGINLVHIFFNDSSLVGPPFVRLGGARVIVSRRDMGFWYSPAKLRILKFSNAFVDCLVANSEGVRKNVIREEGIPECRTAVIYNGHDLARFETARAASFRQEHGIGCNDPVIGLVANLYPMKRPGDLIEAFRIVRERVPNVHLVLVGGGEPEIAVNRRLAKALGLERAVHFPGAVGEVIPVLKNFDMAALCSESEGLSNAIIEYMGCSLPIICTNVGGNPELIRDGYNGFLFKVGDIRTLSERILTLLAERPLARAFGERARKTMEELCSREKMVSSYEDLYQRLDGRERGKT